MIFVTVGTSDFDQLIEKVDELAPSLDEKVLVQIGNGEYIPQHCEYFRFAPSLAPYYAQADLIVAHAGLGTTMEVLQSGKTLISVENVTCIDSHQTDMLGALAKYGYLIWCRNLDELSSLFAYAKTATLEPYVAPQCDIPNIIQKFLDDLM